MHDLKNAPCFHFAVVGTFQGRLGASLEDRQVLLEREGEGKKMGVLREEDMRFSCVVREGKCR